MGGFVRPKKIKEMYEAQLEFPDGWRGLTKNPFRGEGMDIFWNYTISYMKQKNLAWEQGWYETELNTNKLHKTKKLTWEHTWYNVN